MQISKELQNDIMLITKSILNNEFNEDILKILRLVQNQMSQLGQDPYKQFKELENGKSYSQQTHHQDIIKPKEPPKNYVSKLKIDKLSAVSEKKEKIKKIKPKKMAQKMNDKVQKGLGDLLTHFTITEQMLSLDLHDDEARVPYINIEKDAIMVKRINAEGSFTMKYKIADQPTKLECKLQLIKNAQAKILDTFKLSKQEFEDMINLIARKQANELSDPDDFKKYQFEEIEKPKIN